MIRKSHKGIVWLEFELFIEFSRLKHAIFLRHGGVSEGGYASLNLSFGVGDNPKSVQENHYKINDIIKPQKICWSQQVHGHAVAFVDNTWTNNLIECDGIVTNHQHKALMIHHADCQAAILYDPINHALASVHCGWRGSVKNIYAETVAKMKTAYGTLPEDIYAGISPSLGPNCAEFINYRTELPESFWEYQIRPTYFDFWTITHKQLMECGLLSHHIQIAGICTYSNPRDYYSYRREKIRGGHGTIAMLI